MIKAVRIGRIICAAALVSVAIACGNDDDDGVAPIPPGDATIIGNISANRTLFRDTTYTISGFVKIQSGVTLTVQDGTTIKGDFDVAGSSLWILPGGKIMAQGTASRPIVFTSEKASGSRQPGDWGGIIIVGKGRINRTVNPVFTEGPSGTSENYAGGTDNNDNSGVLRYVRIEFAGYDISGAGQELNSLSMYAVGRGTQIEYVQTLMGLDDSFEWFGGAVDGRYLVSYESGDDHFDWTEGYSGRNQFMIAFQSIRPTNTNNRGNPSTDPRGFEGDGCDNALSGCTFTNSPFSMPVFANFTVVGPGTGVFTVTDGNGMVVRRGSGGSFLNGVIARWPGFAVSVRNAESDALRAVDSLIVRGLALAENGNTFDSGTNFGVNLNVAASNITASAATAASLFTSLTASSLDLTPSSGSALRTVGSATFPTVVNARLTSFFGGTIAGTAYVGAADPSASTKWWSGWTSYAVN